MKVLFVTQGFPPHVYGGIAVYVYNLIKHLKKMYSDNISIEVLTIKGATAIGNGYPDLQITVHTIDLLFKGFPFRMHEFILKARSFIRKNYRNYDIIHDNTNFISSNKLPVISTVHSSMLQEAKYYKTNSLVWDVLAKSLTLTLAPAEKNALEKASCIIVPSEYQRNFIKKHFKSRSAVKTISLATDTDLFAPGDKNPCYDIIFAGRTQPRKGLMRLADALSLITDNPLKLLICLQKVSKATEQRLKKLEKCGHEVTIKTNVSYTLMADEYNNSRFLVLPSEFESFGMVAYEAMACGKPVIAADKGAMPEIIRDKVNGILYEYEDTEQLKEAILKILNNPSISKKMGEEAEKTIRNRPDWSQNAHETYKIYKNCLKTAG